MKNMVKSDIKLRRDRPDKSSDQLNNISSFWLWCVPAFITGSGVVLHSNGILSVTMAGAVYTVSIGWIGIGCFINGNRCGRVHCKIDGILFPLLSIAGFLGVVGLINLDWNVFWITFFVILVSSFSVELFWKKYV